MLDGAGDEAPKCDRVAALIHNGDEDTSVTDEEIDTMRVRTHLFKRSSNLSASQDLKSHNISSLPSSCFLQRLREVHDSPCAIHNICIVVQDEFTRAGANWEFVDYSNTLHGFTDPENPWEAEEGGRVAYSPIADSRSWHSAATFFKRIFADDSLYSTCTSK